MLPDLWSKASDRPDTRAKEGRKIGQKLRKLMNCNAYVFVIGNFKVLFNTFAIKNVSALGLDCILCDIVADAANSSIIGDISNKLGCISLAAKNEVGMACHLSHSSEPVTRKN